jgi:diadenosine tetraphosphatase ApaH/serine/threonine PP2A family protein phosphatase
VEDFNPDAAAAALWTRAALSDSDADVLNALPEVQTPDGCTLVHGTLRWPIWEYLVSPDVALAHLEPQETPLGFVGHTHVPMLATQQNGSTDCEMYRLPDGAVVHLPVEAKSVVNPGSVGQPRDGDPRASYSVYDSLENTVALHRVEYAINTTQHLMTEAGLPRWLIERLAVGR